MKYSRYYTIKFGLKTGFKDCLVNLNHLISKEGCLESMPFFNEKDIVLDMDCVESKIARSESRTNNKSMDCCFIAKDINNNEIIIFVEYRFNYKSMKNLKSKDLRDKKKYSTYNLKNIGYTNIHPNFYYVFDPNLKQQARRYFRSLYPSMPSNFKAISISDLKSDFF